MNKLNVKIKYLVSSVLIAANLVSPAAVLAIATPSSPASPSAPTSTVATPDEPAQPSWMEPQVNVTGQSAGSQGGNNEGNSNRRDRDRQVDVTNSGNGAGSDNNSEVDVTNDTDVEATNNADVENNIDMDAKTGQNDASKNMGDGVITTGDASVDGSLVNNLNNTTVNLNDGCGGCTGSIDVTNSGNGADSNNNGSATSNSSTDVNAVNNLYLVNNEDIGAATGSNDANKNMGDGVIVSGDADVVFTTVNLGNNTLINPNVVNFNILDSQSEDLYITFPQGSGSGSGAGLGASNTGNGADSTNTAGAASNSTTNLDTENNLILDNNVDIYASTGNNEANKNMGSGDITTGDANLVSNIINFLNNSIVAGAEFLIGSVNIFGDMSGDIILPREADLSGCGCAADITAANSGNGSGSENSANFDSSNDLTVNQINNAIINTNLTIDANTGGNDANKNMGDSSITTGSADVTSNLVTMANTNTVGSGDTWWLVIVNNQGTYTGKIVGAADGATIDGSGLEFGFNPDGSIYALNSGNGSGSTNNASSTSNTSTTINQTNNAIINNNVNIDANTGNNTANGNMGGVTINTGDVNVASNIVNFINNNFVGGKFMLVFVNIFGSFSGSIVPPDQEIPAGTGGPVGGVGGSVNLPSGTSLSGSSNKKTSSAFTSGGIGSLGQALEEGGKVLESALQTSGGNSITKVVGGNETKSSFSFNYLLIGGALLILAGYAFIARRRAIR